MLHEKASLDVRLAYDKYKHTQWIRFSGMSAIVAGTLIPLFSVLDYLVYPEWFETFAKLRFACTANIVVLVVVSRFFGNSRVKFFTMIGALCIQLMINYMIVVTEGADSGYYAGLNLTVIAMGLILPAVTHETVIFGATTIGLYVLACIYSGILGDYNALVEHVFFLLGTAIIASFSTYFLERRRYQEFLLSYELAERNRELDDLNRQRADFFANISHELRTPLTLILAPVQEILTGSTHLPDRLATRLGVVKDNALRLLKLVNDLLDVIRMEEGAQKLEKKPVNLSGLISALVEGMVYLAATKDIELEKQIPASFLVVEGDSRSLEKILVNVINNAIKFTQRGGAVTVSLSRDGSEAVVQVKDNGIGIEKQDQERIFERFRQVDGTSTRRYRGTGLGLALVKELTEHMGGSVGVDSELGIGTCVTLKFLCSAQQNLSFAETIDVEEDNIELLHRHAEQRGGLELDDVEFVQETDAGASNRPKILVVEDEPDMRRYLVELLGEDFFVLQAKTGTEGLEKALDHEPEVVLLDLMLPEMDGLEVCQRIRRGGATQGPKIMLLTARVDEQSKISALNSGADDFLTKPFSSVEVKTRLRNLLTSASLERDLAIRNESLEATLRELRTTQAQLIHSEKLNALGSLAAGLLHEINNPLNYSLTALQLIRADANVRENELLSEVIGDIDEGMQRIRAIVSDLRAFAYPSEAETQLRFQFGDVLESALRFTSHELRGIDVKIDLPTDSSVLGSKSHITQVLVNLLANSAKAIRAVAEERKGEIRVTGAVKDGRFLVGVADNGIGMDEKTLERIFDPFFTTRDVGQGMGLGLSICHTIVSNHGGRLRASSKPGQGAELLFDLPAENGVC